MLLRFTINHEEATWLCIITTAIAKTVLLISPTKAKNPATVLLQGKIIIVVRERMPDLPLEIFSVEVVITIPRIQVQVQQTNRPVHHQAAVVAVPLPAGLRKVHRPGNFN